MMNKLALEHQVQERLLRVCMQRLFALLLTFLLQRSKLIGHTQIQNNDYACRV